MVAGPAGVSPSPSGGRAASSVAALGIGKRSTLHGPPTAHSSTPFSHAPAQAGQLAMLPPGQLGQQFTSVAHACPALTVPLPQSLSIMVAPTVVIPPPPGG